MLAGTVRKAESSAPLSAIRAPFASPFTVCAGGAGGGSRAGRDSQARAGWSGSNGAAQGTESRACAARLECPRIADAELWESLPPSYRCSHDRYGCLAEVASFVPPLAW